MHDLIHDLATSLFSASASSSIIRETNVGDYSHRMSIGFAELVPSYSPSLLIKFSLRMLNLIYTELEQLPFSIGDLVHLRDLDLSGNSRICSLPKQLRKLHNLQTLDLHNCHSLCCYPKQTSKFGSLRNRLLDGCPLACVPPRIGSLTCLKTLDCFAVGRKKGCQLDELRNLNLYGSISITQLERVKNDKDTKQANISAKGNLHSLSMSWDERQPHRYESEDVKVLEDLKPHPNLTSLSINGFRGFRLPEWMNHSVLKNILYCNYRLQKLLVLPPFGDLPCLESLELYWGCAEYVEEEMFKSFANLKKLPTSLASLNALKSLKIEYCYALESLPEEGVKGLTSLTQLSLQYCKMLKCLPEGLQHLKFENY